MREPSVEGGVPGCWGRYRGDVECDTCPRAERCHRASQDLVKRETVREHARRVGMPEAQRARIDAIEPEDLARYAQACYVKAGGKRPWVPWGVTRGYVTAMEAVCAACYAAGWSPKRYVEAQIQSLIANIKTGWPIQPGHFTGKNANARFSRWVARREAAFGNAKSDTRSDESALAASLAYVECRADGGDAATATEVARGLFPSWTVRLLREPRVKAMCAERIVERLSPGLADNVLIPTGKWRISDVLALCALLRESVGSDPTPRATTSGSILGDFL